MSAEKRVAAALLAGVLGIAATELADALADPDTRAGFRAGTRVIMRDDAEFAWRYIIGPLIPKNITVDGDGAEYMKGLYLSVCTAIDERRMGQSGKAGSGESHGETTIV